MSKILAYITVKSGKGGTKYKSFKKYLKSLHGQGKGQILRLIEEERVEISEIEEGALGELFKRDEEIAVLKQTILTYEGPK